MKNTTCAFFAPGPWAGKPTIAFLVGWAQMPQVAQVTSSRTVAGQMETRFGYVIATGVWALSDMESGNRVERKALSRERLARIPDWLQSVKCADLISNTSSIVTHDPKFAVTYLEEKRLLLDVLTLADPRLHLLARQQAEVVDAY